MKIATWNLEFLKRTSSRDKTAKIVATLKEVGADIWILTETNSAISPGDGYTPVFSDPLPVPGPYNRRTGDYEAMIWSKFPLSQISIAESSTSVCAKAQTSLGEVYFYGTVIGILGNRVSTFHSDLQKQLADWQRINELGAICIAGDFNISWDSYYFTKDGRAKITDCFTKLGIANLTSEVKQNIDHIAISKPFEKTAECTWNLDKTLSDHIGVSVSVERSDLDKKRGSV